MSSKKNDVFSRRTSTPRKERVFERFVSRIRFSLVTRLRLMFFVKMLFSFLAFNVILLVGSTFLLTYQTDQNVVDIHKQLDTMPLYSADAPTFYTGYRTENQVYWDGMGTKEYRKVFTVIETVLKKIVPEDETYQRRIFAVRKEGNEMSSFTYAVYDEVSNRVVTYDMNRWLHGAIFLWQVVFLIELLVLVTRLIDMRKEISQILSPIDDLAATVHTINDLDVTARIAVHGTQNELADLATDINDMLDRIQTSYAAQVQFVSDASHELRTPIAVIQGYADLLTRWGKKDEAALDESIEAIRNETESMKNLVEQLLFLARGDNNMIRQHKSALEVSSLLGDTVNDMRMIDKTHEFIYHEGESVWVLGDMQLMKQALRIFLDNAMKYTPENGKIYLSADMDGEIPYILIRDEGIGMSPEQVARMFDRFYRADDARTRAAGGSGLGLSIAKRILLIHEAEVEIKSREHFGTEIKLRFPPFSICDVENEEEVLAELKEAEGY